MPPPAMPRGISDRFSPSSVDLSHTSAYPRQHVESAEEFACSVLPIYHKEDLILSIFCGRSA